jgi:hypothetical protein
MQQSRITLQLMNNTHPLAQFLTGFLAVSVLTLLYVTTPNRVVSVAPTPTQALETAQSR